MFAISNDLRISQNLIPRKHYRLYGNKIVLYTYLYGMYMYIVLITKEQKC